jgi:nucleoside-diphosphate-sugar epimerase
MRPRAVNDLVDFVERLIANQTVPFELVNVGSGATISVAELAQKIIQKSGKTLNMEFDRTKPTLPFRVKLNIDRAKARYQWVPRTSLEEGVQKTLSWYRANYLEKETAYEHR